MKTLCMARRFLQGDSCGWIGMPYFLVDFGLPSILDLLWLEDACDPFGAVEIESFSTRAWEECCVRFDVLLGDTEGEDENADFSYRDVVLDCPGVHARLPISNRCIDGRVVLFV